MRYISRLMRPHSGETPHKRMVFLRFQDKLLLKLPTFKIFPFVNYRYQLYNRMISSHTFDYNKSVQNDLMCIISAFVN
jgi:hypothetical protein